MPTLASRIAFAQKHVRTKTGEPFSLKDRDWVVDDYWRPADGHKLWPNDQQRLCDACKEAAGTILETHLFAVPDGHEPEHCAGLKAHPIICVVLNLKRRSGKTFNTAAYALSTMCQSRKEWITFVAASEDQTHDLFVENYCKVIGYDQTLKNLLHPVGNTLTCKRTGSFFECVSTSHSSITGRGRTRIIIDEARDIAARTAVALIPSVFDNAGIECRRGHLRREGPAWIKRLDTETLKCTVCDEPLTPWYGRIIITSAQGLIEGGEKDWFAELVEWLTENPHPNYHLLSTAADMNPAVSQTTVSAIEDVFGQIESTRGYMDIEINNQARRKGEDFVSTHTVQRCCDRSLRNVEGSTRPSFGFLDTSLTVEKTSLVILGDDIEQRRAGDRPWARVVTERIDYWEPAKMEGGVIDEAIILAHLDRYMPLFPGLKAVYVDTRIQPWAIRFVKFCRSNRPWGKRIHDFNGSTPERNAAWQVLEAHLKAGTIRLIDHPELKKELAGVRKQTNINNSVEVRDRNRRRRHADIAEGLAECCRQAFLASVKRNVGLGQLGGTGAADVHRQIMPGKMSINNY